MVKRLLVILILLSNILLAKDYALIIGVWDYDKSKTYFNKLKSKIVKSDIAIYKKILIDWGISKKDIKELNNSNATKKNIINYLKDVNSSSEKINRFYMFFTGHGLSAKNKYYENRILKKNNKSIKENMKYSGAIIPYGLDERNLDDTLIIGCLDLKPLLEEIDKKAKTGLIMFDACYSEKSSRDNKTKKRINLSKKALCTNKDMGYPYKKLVYISSSSRKAELGNVSKGLEKCLSKGDNQTLKKQKIEECISDNPELKAQRAKVFGQNDLSVF